MVWEDARLGDITAMDMSKKIAHLLAMSPDFCSRLYCTGLISQKTHTLAARVFAGPTAHVVFGGYMPSELLTVEPLHPTREGRQEGWFAVISHDVAGGSSR